MNTAQSTADIADLVARLGNGDQGALAELFARYGDQLRRMVAFRLDQRLNGRVSSSDILQEAYIDALKRIPHFLSKPEMPIGAWLRLIVGQRLIEVHRQHLGAKIRAANQEISLDQAGWLPASSPRLVDHLVGHLTSPSQAAMRNESSAHLEEALRNMDALDREVLALRHFEELSNNEVAEILGITKAAASKRYVRALDRLKDALAAVPGFGEQANTAT
jgi:RNA polymerase sigma-70 factor (ECF subfamily)